MDSNRVPLVKDCMKRGSRIVSTSGFGGGIRNWAGQEPLDSSIFSKHALAYRIPFHDWIIPDYSGIIITHQLHQHR